MEVLTAPPARIAAGTSLRYTRDYSSRYPASAGWEFTLHVKGRSAKDVTGTPAGDALTLTQFTLLPADTAAIEPGLYYCTERAERGTGNDAESVDVTVFELLVTTDIAAATQGEMQSWLEKQLERIDCLIDAQMANRLTATMNTWSIAGRGAERLKLPELYQLRAQCIAALERERNPGRGRASSQFQFTTEGPAR